MKTGFPREYGRYRLLGLLGSGGMAEVYRAESQPIAGITRTVAIKRILADARDPQLQTMLLDEARIWVRLQHPNIVSVVDFGEIDGDWFLALELIDGVTASALVREAGPLPVAEALCITERVAKALAHAHSLEEGGRRLGIIHRDVKPQNILLSLRGEVKLTDFGIARATDRLSHTQAGLVKGSLPYMSPEQVRGEELDGRSDLFALGCTLHWLATGRLLVDGPREAVLDMIARGEVPPPHASLPRPLREVVASLTAADRRRRPATAAEVAKQLRAMLLPSAVEDVEPVLAARVATARGEIPTAPPGVTTIPRVAPLEEATAPRAPVAPSTETPIAPRPARTWRPPATSLALLGAGVAVFLGASLFASRWYVCDAALASRTSVQLTGGTLAEEYATLESAMRGCRSTPELRSARALAARRAKKKDVALESSPLEARAADLLERDANDWQDPPAFTWTHAIGTDDLCYQEIVAFDARASRQITWPRSAESAPCALVLRGSSALASGRLADATSLFEKALPRRNARLGLALAAALKTPPAEAAVEGHLDAALRDVGALDEDAAGVWIPSSFAPLPGETGRLSTALDDTATLAALVRGDFHARHSRWNDALREYRGAQARGATLPDLATRLADIAYLAGDAASLGVALAGARKSPEVKARTVLLHHLRRDSEVARSQLASFSAELAPETLSHLEAILAGPKKAVAAPAAKRNAVEDEPLPLLDERQQRLAYGKRLFDQGDIAGAKRIFVSLVLRDPTYADGHLALGLAFLAEKRKWDACRHLRRYVDLEPNSPHAKDVRGIVADCYAGR